MTKLDETMRTAKILGVEVLTNKKRLRMTDDDIDKTIAKFMGWHEVEGLWYCGDSSNCYTSHPIFNQSLDALIPVVEKLKEMMNITYLPNIGTWISHNSGSLVNNDHEDKSPSRALAAACCEVIKSMK